MNIVYLQLGSNIGERDKMLSISAQAISEEEYIYILKFMKVRLGELMVKRII